MFYIRELLIYYYSAPGWPSLGWRCEWLLWGLLSGWRSPELHPGIVLLQQSFHHLSMLAIHVLDSPLLRLPLSC